MLLYAYYEGKGYLTMLERLWEEDPKIQKYLADKGAEKISQGISEGIELSIALAREEGRVHALQWCVMTLVRKRFPTIAEPVIRKMEQVNNAIELKRLFKLIFNAPDEARAFWILNQFDD